MKFLPRTRTTQGSTKLKLLSKLLVFFILIHSQGYSGTFRAIQ
jgi:hypothetical protein